MIENMWVEVLNKKMVENMRKNIDITKVAVNLELDSDAIED